MLVAGVAPARAVLLDPMFGGLVTEGGAGLGVAVRTERSPYRDVEARYDLLPLYLYEGEWFYLHSYRAGLKLPVASPDWRLEIFLAERFEGFPIDGAPAALSGMASREPGVDGGSVSSTGCRAARPSPNCVAMSRTPRTAPNSGSAISVRSPARGGRWSPTS